VNKSESKTVSDSFKLSGAITEELITKFALSPNARGKVKVQFSSDEAHRYPSYMTALKVYFYSSEQTWQKVKNAPTCQEKIQFATKSHSLDFSKQQQDNNWIAKLDTSFSDVNELEPHPQYWYITVADCALELQYLDNKIPTLHYTLEIMDELSTNNYTHLSHDEQGLTTLHLFNILLSLSIAAWLFYQMIQRYSQRNELHLSIIMVFAACLLHALSSGCQMIHLQLYAHNGIGSYSADAISAHAEALVDSLLCWIMLAVGVGWTLPLDFKAPNANANANSLLHYIQRGFQSSSPSNTTSTLWYQNPAVQLLIGLETIHAILCQWGRTYNDDFDCYHDLEHRPGRILLFVRLVLSILFLFFTAALKQKCHARGHFSLISFLQKFSLIGASWFISLPSLALLISSSSSSEGSLFHIPAHRRHPIMTTLGMALQVVSLMSLGWLFAGTENTSPYHRVNNVNDSSMGGLGTYQASSSSSSNVSNNVSIQNADAGAGGRSIFKFGKTKVRLD